MYACTSRSTVVLVTYSSQFSSASNVYIRLLLWSVTSGLRRPYPLACAVGHTTTFAVNGALMASQCA